MKIRKLILSILIVLFWLYGCTTVGSDRKQPDTSTRSTIVTLKTGEIYVSVNGYFWNLWGSDSYGLIAKQSLIMGMVEGMHLYYTVEEIIEKDSIYPIESKMKIHATINEIWKIPDLNGFIGMIDSIYKDPANLKIPLTETYMHEIFFYKGMVSPNDHATNLMRLRKKYNR